MATWTVELSFALWLDNEGIPNTLDFPAIRLLLLSTGRARHIPLYDYYKSKLAKREVLQL